MTRPNAFDADFSAGYEEGDPPGYHCAEAPFGKAAGGKELAVRLFELPAGQTLCPYHYEYVEEWLLVLEGELVVRVPDGEERLSRGDIVAFPLGPAGAHKVSNRGSAPARIVMFSSGRVPAVSVYPDSDKLGVWPGSDRDNLMVRRAEGHLDYYDGER